jgi:hypothetical protein
VDPNLSKDDNQTSSTSHVVVPPPSVNPPTEPVTQPVQAPVSGPPVSPNPSAPVLPPGVTTIPSQEPTQPASAPSEPSVAPPPSSGDQSFQDLPKKKRVNGKVASVLVALLIVAAVPLTVFLTNQQQNIKSGASNQDPVVGTLNQNGALKEIHKSDLLPIAQEQYSSDSITKDVLLTARDTYVERQILDMKQQELGLPFPAQTDIDSLSNEIGISQNQAKYELLKQEIIASQVNWVKAVSIGFWSPPDNAGQDNAFQSSVNSQLTEGVSAMDYAKNQLNSGQDVLTITQSIYSNPSYSSLTSALALNGIKFSQLEEADKQTAAEPVLYEYEDTNFDTATRSLLFSTPVNQVVTSIADTSNAGKVIFKIIDKGSGTFGSYNKWLIQQKNTLYHSFDF